MELLKVECPYNESSENSSKQENDDLSSGEVDSQSLSYTPNSVSHSETSSDYELSLKSGSKTKPKS